MMPIKPDRYRATFIDCELLHLPVVNLRKNAVASHRCLNYTLHVEAPAYMDSELFGCIPMDNTRGPYAHIVQFFRQIGWFRDIETFNEKELEGLRVEIDTGIVFDRKLGLRPYVIRFHPLPQLAPSPH